MNDRELADLVRSLTNTEPTAAQVALAHRLRDHFRFSDSDPIWAFLLVLGHYTTVMDVAPGKLEAAVTACIQQANQAATHERSAIVADAKRDVLKTLDENVAASLARISKTLNGRRFAYGLAVAVSLVLAALFVAFRAGMAVSSAETAGELAWLRSPPGQAAAALAQFNDVQGMMSCATFERLEEGGKVFCRPVRDRMIFGWRIQ